MSAIRRTCARSPRASRHGVDISGLRARQLRAADFDDFDWLLCADHANLRDVQALAPQGIARGSACSWNGRACEGAIPDPYTGGSDDFEQVWSQVDAAAQAAADGCVAAVARIDA